jgi:hypothetical protein
MVMMTHSFALSTTTTTRCSKKISMRINGSSDRKMMMSLRTRAMEKDGRTTKASEELAEKFTTGGGGADGFCDYDDIKEAIKDCEGLEGARLEACYAEYGCNVDAVTEHYSKAAGIEPKKEEK